MNTVLVWVLVFYGAVNSGGIVQVAGDYATSADCERVAAEVRKREELRSDTPSAVCVQVTKVKP